MHFARTACCLAISSCLALPAYAAERSMVFGGVSLESDTYYTYVGGVHALGGDIAQDGWLLRGSAAYGGYDYEKGATGIDGNVAAFDLMAGYQAFWEDNHPLVDSRVSGYLGADYQNHDLSPADPANEVRGSELGVKAQAEALWAIDEAFYTSATANYSSAFDSYWSRVLVGYDIGGIAIGPEALFMGSESYDQQRYGVFVDHITLFEATDLGLSGGFSNASRRGDDGGYVELRVSSRF